MKLRKIASPTQKQPNTNQGKLVTASIEPMKLKVKTALRAGDMYLHIPSGSNNRGTN